MPDTLLSTTKCERCGVKFESEKIPIVGEHPGAKTQRLMQKLMEHLKLAHKEQLDEIFRASQHYNTLMILQLFELTDPPLIEARETARKFAEEILTRKQTA